jgi:hypothetical protein
MLAKIQIQPTNPFLFQKYFFLMLSLGFYSQRDIYIEAVVIS